MKELSKLIKGKYAEKEACRILKKNDYKIIRLNFTCKTGEIDIIAWDKKVRELVFVEVRFRKFGIDAAIDSVSYTKQKRIMRAANWFRLRNKKFSDCYYRFDIFAMAENQSGKLIYQHIKDAFPQP